MNQLKLQINFKPAQFEFVASIVLYDFSEVHIAEVFFIVPPNNQMDIRQRIFQFVDYVLLFFAVPPSAGVGC